MPAGDGAHRRWTPALCSINSKYRDCRPKQDSAPEIVLAHWRAFPSAADARLSIQADLKHLRLLWDMVAVVMGKSDEWQSTL